VISGIVGGVTMGVGQTISPVADKALSGIASPVLRGAITQGVVGAGVGGIGGGLGAVMSGGDFWNGVGQGALWGGGIGLATGAYTGYAAAKSQGINPWTGKPAILESNQSNQISQVPDNNSEPLQNNRVDEIMKQFDELKAQGQLKSMPLKSNQEVHILIEQNDIRISIRIETHPIGGNQPIKHMNVQVWIIKYNKATQINNIHYYLNK